jgi:hypothetical protein
MVVSEEDEEPSSQRIADLPQTRRGGQGEEDAEGGQPLGGEAEGGDEGEQAIAGQILPGGQQEEE